MIKLSPPLENLAECLFCDARQPDIQLQEPAPDSVSTNDESWRDVAVPDFVRAAIASHVAARVILQPKDLRAGDIILLDHIGKDDKHEGRPLHYAVGVLLVTQKVADVWRGFVVAGEQDYASQFDVFIDKKDEPVDPAMRFVQAWNPIEMVTAAECHRLGVLSAARLAAVSEVSNEALAGLAPTALPSSITRIGLRQLASGASVVTGTSIGNVNDPRRQYQSLYRALAREVSVPAIGVAEEQVRKNATSPPQSPWKSWLWPTLAGVAATLLIGQNLQLRSHIDIEKQEAVRSVIPPAVSSLRVGPRLRVTFKPNVGYEAVAKAIRDIGAQFVSGPDDNGDVLLSVSAERMQEAATVLRIRDLVDSVEMLPEQKETAK